MIRAANRNPRVHGINRRISHLVKLGRGARTCRIRVNVANRNFIFKRRALKRNCIDLELRAEVAHWNFNAVGVGVKSRAVDKDFVLDGVWNNIPVKSQNIFHARDNRRRIFFNRIFRNVFKNLDGVNRRGLRVVVLREVIVQGIGVGGLS